MSRVGDPARLEARVARKSFRTASGQSVPVLANLSFALEEGETGALIGPSGCGKSTLMRILAGLDRDFEGSVHIPTHGRVGMVFQEPRLLPWRSVEDNVRLAASNVSEAEVAALFAALGLSDHRTHFPGELSVGLARRTALARAFAVRPTLLLLDEPFVSLDAPLARQLQRDLARLVESRGMITVLVTHDIDEAIALADRIFVLSARPARVVGEVQVMSPRGAMSGEERKAAARGSRPFATQAESPAERGEGTPFPSPFWAIPMGCGAIPESVPPSIQYNNVYRHDIPKRSSGALDGLERLEGGGGS
jgi:ABC-type nitrate/sulfonate/bicarbonate transport system ATPase subunit